MKTALDISDESFLARQRDQGVLDPDSFRTITLTGGGESIKRLIVRERMKPFKIRFLAVGVGHTIQERNVPYKGRFLAAVPGESLNKRIYTKEVLQQAAPFYDGKPFILDHDIEHGERVVGILSHPRYGVERGMDGTVYEGLWLDGVGLMDEDLFEKVKGDPAHGIPPLIRGVSIGGEDPTGGEWADGGILLKKFLPAELSITAFPGIPAAHIAAINMIHESLKRSHGQEVKRTSIPVKETDISLEEAEKQAAKLREGPLPPPEQDTSRPPIRGGGTPQGFARLGLPTPTVRKDVLHSVPAATTSADVGVKLNPEEQAPGTAGSPGSKDAKSWQPKIPKAGSTTTKTPGFGKLSPSGTGLQDQSEEEEEEESRKVRHGPPPPVPAKKDRTASEFPEPRATHKPPNEEEEEESHRLEARENPPHKPGEQEEEEEEERHKVRQHKGGSGTMMAKGREEEEEEGEEEEEEEQFTPGRTKLGHTTTKTPGFGKLSPSGSGMADQSEEEEEENLKVRQDDEPTGVTKDMQPMKHPDDVDKDDENPILKVAKDYTRANPIRSGGEEHFAAPDVVPIEARAFSLPIDTGIYQMALRFDALRRGPDRSKEAAEYIKVWNDAKKVEQPPLKRVRVKTEKSKVTERSAAQGSLVSTVQPTITPRTEAAIPTRSLTNIAPAAPIMSASSSVATITATAENLLEKVRGGKFGYYNPAGRAWRELLPQIIDVR